ncbi:MAG: helix-turn-helix domain-containing protein, partial [Chloroflexota bacterium]
RRSIASACTGDSRSAGELVELAGLAPASVSEHLKVLRKSGVLLLERRGRFWYYETSSEVLERAGRAIAELGT